MNECQVRELNSGQNSRHPRLDRSYVCVNLLVCYTCYIAYMLYETSEGCCRLWLLRGLATCSIHCLQNVASIISLQNTINVIWIHTVCVEPWHGEAPTRNRQSFLPGSTSFDIEIQGQKRGQHLDTNTVMVNLVQCYQISGLLCYTPCTCTRYSHMAIYI